MRTYNKYMDGSRILLGSHRGDRKHFPENTMSAFRACVELGLDAIETDVRMTKDGHLVLIHDRSVTRTTNGEGSVDLMTLEELRALDAGFWKGPEHVGERIPTVEEFLELIAPTNIIINWELKEYPRDHGERAYECVDKLVELIDRYGVAERSLINSFSQKLLEYVNDKWPGKFQIHSYPDYIKFDVSKKPLDSFSDWIAIWRKDAEHLSGFAADYEYAAHRGLPTCILVPDDPAHYKKAIELGCKMFTSDDPAKAVEILKKLGVRG
jgi:glycerophosphoryl diester phosphodiesterase